LRGAAVFHPTYYNLTGDLRWSDIKCPVVVTAHDFIHAAYPTLMEEVGWTLKCQQAAFERADRIICVSNATKSDLLERFPQVKGPVDVIYHGTSFPVVRRERPDAAFERPTFLFVGARGGYKNFSFLLNAFAKVCTKHSTVHLQVAGHNFTTEERWQIYLLGLTDRVSLCALPDEEQLMSFYQSCVALLYPSMHEGFGIPPLEAMASGAIPVTTNRSSLPEVMGDCGVMLDANAEDQWVECILKLCSPSAWRTDLMERGWSRAQRFAWETTAQKHVEIYQTFR
jgi:glycosyltransferase involved in cell wall biosynthesis